MANGNGFSLLKKKRHPIYGKRTFSQRLADDIAKYAGSWVFIIVFGLILAVWVALNMTLGEKIWDPYPFILLNLFLSVLAAIQAPVILMSQNRAGERDRHKAEMDYMINRKAEREIKDMQKDLEEIKTLIKKRKL